MKTRLSKKEMEEAMSMSPEEEAFIKNSRVVEFLYGVEMSEEGDKLCSDMAATAIYACLNGLVEPIHLHKLSCLLYAFLQLRWDVSQSALKDVRNNFDAQITERIPDVQELIGKMEAYPSGYRPVKRFV